MKTAKAKIPAEAKALRRIPGGEVLDLIRLYADDLRDIITEPNRPGRTLHAGGLLSRIWNRPRDRHYNLPAFKPRRKSAALRTFRRAALPYTAFYS